MSARNAQTFRTSLDGVVPQEISRPDGSPGPDPGAGPGVDPRSSTPKSLLATANAPNQWAAGSPRISPINNYRFALPDYNSQTPRGRTEQKTGL